MPQPPICDLCFDTQVVEDQVGAIHPCPACQELTSNEHREQERIGLREYREKIRSKNEDCSLGSSSGGASSES